MEKIKVRKSDLLQKMEANRAAHRATFEDALSGYRKEVIEHLEKMLSEARLGKRVRRNIELIEPMDQTKDYDRVIAMLNMSIDDVFELDEQTFACYVLDDWHWKGQFNASTMSYVNKK
jgi:hypothetical protein